MALLGSKKDDANLREDLRILATNIESVNQRLDTMTGNTALQDLSKKMDYLLDYLYQLVQQGQNPRPVQVQQAPPQQPAQHPPSKSQQHKPDLKPLAALKEFSGEKKLTLEQVYKELQELKASFERAVSELREAIKELGDAQRLTVSEITSIKKILAELVKIYKEETLLFRDQGDAFEKKMEEVENRLSSLERRKAHVHH